MRRDMNNTTPLSKREHHMLAVHKEFAERVNSEARFNDSRELLLSQIDGYLNVCYVNGLPVSYLRHRLLELTEGK